MINVTTINNYHSYRVKVTKTQWLINRNSKHVKTTPFTAEQCMRDWLSRNMVLKTLEDILKKYKQHTQHNDYSISQDDKRTTKWTAHQFL